jgi:hypothetical protein
MSRSTALERTRLLIRGGNSELLLEDGRVTITKHSVAPAQVRFDISRIRSTALVAAKAGGRGWLHVNVVGGTPTPPGELVAMTDPYTVRITGRSAGAGKRFVRMVHDHLRARGLPSEPDLGEATPPDGRYSSAVVLTDATPNGADAGRRAADADRPRQLEQLSELHASGALTDEEFERVRARLGG